MVLCLSCRRARVRIEQQKLGCCQGKTKINNCIANSQVLLFRIIRRVRKAKRNFHISKRKANLVNSKRR